MVDIETKKHNAKRKKGPWPSTGGVINRYPDFKPNKVVPLKHTKKKKGKGA